MSKILNVPIDLSIAPSGTLYIWCAKIEKNINLDISTFHCSHSSTFALREAWKTPNLWLILLVLISSVNKIQTFLSDPTGDSLANPLVLTTSVCPYTYWGLVVPPCMTEPPKTSSPWEKVIFLPVLDLCQLCWRSHQIMIHWLSKIEFVKDNGNDDDENADLC